MCDFVHLHCHSQYSLLDGASDISLMLDKAKRDGQTATAITDHGNMYGVYKFVNEAQKRDIKPIIGCEFYLVEDRFKRSFKRAAGEFDRRFHQLLLAKNATGYSNLSKLCSLGFIDGLYGKYPRIDKSLIEQYHEGLIATSCCLAAEIPQDLVKGDMEGAEKKLKWWLDIFGDDFYIELMRHKGLENIDYFDYKGRRTYSGKSLEDINQELIILAKKHNIEIIATNDSHYVEEEDWVSHDILLCVNTGKKLEEENRFKFPSSDYYFKTQAEMAQAFTDFPEALANTVKIADKVENINLARDVLLPAFPLPNKFKTQQEYLRHLTFEGAKRRYGEVNAIVEERLNYELGVIENSGYPGYFLIVYDLTKTAREMNVSVGPGRGSAAGSAVAYCLEITNIDPIKYDLLFERFLNPERISMPDIDIDFDDEGRQKVIDYVVQKYGRNQVAQIVTYGTMGAKLAIRDVARVMDIPLDEVNSITKMFPSHLGASLKKVLADGGVDAGLASKMSGDDIGKANNFRKLTNDETDVSQMILTAKKLEGSVRNTGIHACGIIITPDEITKYVPVAADKRSNLLISQFDNSVAENAGLLKMDFLGLKTLTIISDAVMLVKKTLGEELNIDAISLEDEKTYQLFQRGETVGIFQYESAGMQKYMKELKPSTFEDLIAMNALYRPGPIEYIPNFIKRKHGQEEISYDLPVMENYLKGTYGITVYQEQVMLLSQELAGFSKGQADTLRKGMGKKKKALIDKLYPLFISGGTERGHEEDKLKKIWKDWEAFASYAFNKSHSTCYAYIAFQTAYLKANYPAQFMASVLTHERSDLSKLSFYLDECNRMEIEVLGPSVNESYGNFTVTPEGNIRFGLSAIKGVGEKVVEDIIEERKKGAYSNIFDFVIRNTKGSANKKSVEALALGGGFDCFEDLHRAQYFSASGKYDTFIEHLISYGSNFNKLEQEMEFSLFGNTDEVMIPEPEPPKVPEWPDSKKLQKEKDVIGIYASGHPLDIYAFELKHFVSFTLDLYDDNKVDRRPVCVAGMVSDVRRGENSRGNGYCRFELSDYKGSQNFGLYRESFSSFQHLIHEGSIIYIKGIFSKSRKNDQFYFNPTEIGLLESLGDNRTKAITLGIRLKNIDANYVERLQKILDDYPGSKKVSFKILEAENNLTVKMKKGGMGLNICSELIDELKKLDIQYRLN